MKFRWIFWGLAIVLVAAASVLLVPKSPWHITKLMTAGGQYDGQPTRFWIKALGNDDAKTRREAAFALGVIGEDSKPAVPRLAEMMLNDEAEAVRIDAALALSKLRGSSVAALDALIQGLGSDDDPVRFNCAVALGHLGGQARRATPALLKAAKVPRNHTNLRAFTVTIQEQALLAAGKTSAGTDEAVSALTQAMQEPDTEGMRRAAVRSLGFVGPAAKPALQPLRELEKKTKIKDLLEEVEISIKLIEG